VDTAPCSTGRMPAEVGWWGTGAISSQASSWTTTGCDLVIHCKKIVALLFRGGWPCSPHPSHSDLDSGGPGCQACASAQLLALMERGVHTRVLLLLQPFWPSQAWVSCCSSPSGNLPVPCFLPFHGLRSWADGTGTVCSSDMD